MTEGMMTEEGEEFGWEVLVPYSVHPLKVAIIEAFRWIGRPMASSELRLIFDKKFSVPYVAYHVKVLAKAGVLVEVEKQPVRGAVKTTYFFANGATGLQ
jgi:hypothetical protein